LTVTRPRHRTAEIYFALSKPPFDLLRACFWLLAALVGVALLGMLVTIGFCDLAVWTGRVPVGTCVKLDIPEMLRDWWESALTAVMALLVARGPPPPPAPPPTEPD